MKILRVGAICIAHLALILLPCGCEIESSDSFARNVSVDFSGFYTACDENDSIVQQVTGARIRTLDLRQTGDQLQAIDNNSLVWRGALGEPQNGRSSFELRGRTTEGVEGIFSGTLSSSDGGTTNSSGGANGSMTGTFIEPNLFSTFCANADIPGTIDDGNDDGGSGGDLSVSASPTTISSPTGTASLSVSGGTPPYTWSTPSAGTISLPPSGNGSSATYNRNSAANATVTLTVTDNTGETGQVTIQLTSTTPFP